MEDFHNPDGTMRSADDGFTAMWKAWNIKTRAATFYCGNAGWRVPVRNLYVRTRRWVEECFRV